MKNETLRKLNAERFFCHTMEVIPFHSFFPSRFIFFPTTGYMAVTATVAAVMPSAIPAAKPQSFMIKDPLLFFMKSICFKGLKNKLKNMEKHICP